MLHIRHEVILRSEDSDLATKTKNCDTVSGKNICKSEASELAPDKFLLHCTIKYDYCTVQDLKQNASDDYNTKK